MRRKAEDSNRQDQTAKNAIYLYQMCLRHGWRDDR